MLRLALIGSVLIVITVVIHAAGTTTWVRHLARQNVESMIWKNGQAIAILIKTVLVVFILHIIEIMVWAVAYQVLLPLHELGSFEEAVYFSFVTFTTLGYGDITLSEGWRILSGIEALNGILLVGWTTALIFAVVRFIWRAMSDNNK
jgi:hypothetical protein